MINTEHQGVVKARNVALEHIPADADFISFLDSDDISPANRICKDLQAFQEDPSIQFTYGMTTFVDQLDDDTLEPIKGSRQVTVRGIQLGAGIFRKQFLHKLGPFDESFVQGEDTDYIFRAFESNAHHRLTDTICVYYRRHPGNMTRDKEVVRKAFMRAVHESAARRRRDPTLASLSGKFDIRAIIDTPID
jgi:glycosyltransferase involved in cell wall biosynthesis